MGATRDLLVIFIALEIMSLAVYVLTGIKRTSEQGAEAAFKYFVLGAFSSAFFLYGIALTYAAAGTTKLDEIGVRIAGAAQEPNILFILAMVLLLIGFAFKVSAVPFHMWTPDAYQGAPTLVTGFMSTGVKAAAFAAFVRVFLSAFEPLRLDWMPVLSAIAGLTMILGTVVGVAQSSIKRMLAYSSIAHAGYLLVGLIAATAAGKAAILFYLAVYAVTNLGAFGVLAALSTNDRPHDDIRDFSGLWHERPGMAALLTIFLLSLGGFPPTVGFVAKWYIFNAAVQEASDLARHSRRPDECRLRVLLPADRRADVHVGHGSRRPSAARAARRAHRHSRRDDRRLLPRLDAGSVAVRGGGVGRVDFLGPGFEAPVRTNHGRAHQATRSRTAGSAGLSAAGAILAVRRVVRAAERRRTRGAQSRAARRVVRRPEVAVFDLSRVSGIEGEQYAQALALAKASDEYVEARADGRVQHRARFVPGDRPLRLRDLYDLVSGLPDHDVLIDDRPVPYARELWLPLVWMLIR